MNALADILQHICEHLLASSRGSRGVRDGLELGLGNGSGGRSNSIGFGVMSRRLGFALWMLSTSRAICLKLGLSLGVRAQHLRMRSPSSAGACAMGIVGRSLLSIGKGKIRERRPSRDREGHLTDDPAPNELDTVNT